MRTPVALVELWVGDATAEAPDPGQDVPAARAALGIAVDVRAELLLDGAMAASNSSIVVGVVGDAGCLDDRVVEEQDARVGVERQAVVVVAALVGGERPGEDRRRDGLEVRHLLVEREQGALVRELRDPDDVGAQDVRQDAAGDARHELLSQVVVGDLLVLDGDVRVRAP